ncbi:MAG: phosphatidylglycerol lysyltransferase domain-containing protein [Oscillospiraceae bacterium]|jgi:hypothetical protein|nr:phosphatidylglycerol lysyltransferase domain-containing protein [Oscillospiraceae bacterium]
MPDEFEEKVTIEKRGLIEDFIERTPGNLGSLFCFPEFIVFEKYKYFYNIFENLLCISENCDGRIIILPPLGDYNLKNFCKAIDKIFDFFEKRVLIFGHIPSQLLGFFLSLGKKYRIRFFYNIDSSDYLYQTEKLKNLIKNSKKRRHSYNNFVRKYKPEIEEINSENKQMCYEITKNFFCKQNCKNCVYGCEKKIISTTIEKYEKLGYMGFFVKLDSDYIGFSLNKKVKNQLYFHQKKMAHINGLNEYIINSNEKKYEDTILSNCSEDMGILGLRIHKSRICEYTLKHKFFARIIKI